MTYAWVARAGLDVPWTVTVRRAGGFPGPVTLAVTSDYFDIFESQGLDPEPATETADDTNLYWTFDPPPGETLSVDFDAYIQPSSQLGESGEVSVVDAGRLRRRCRSRPSCCPEPAMRTEHTAEGPVT
ncbi:hypothetical protein ACFQV8_13425 [Pseudonocardia benzenivorans]